MEERLRQFLAANQTLDEEQSSNAVLSFLHHQVMQLAQDCLSKSQDKMITRSYMYELLDNLEKLLIDVSTHSTVNDMPSPPCIKKKLIKKG
jgi:microtubule-associated serine/threonine kinase